MSESKTYHRHKDVIGKLMELGKKKNSKSLKRFAILHDTDQDNLSDVALNEPDYELKALAVEKLINENVLLEVALNNNPNNIKELAISKIHDKKKLLHLRLSQPPELQPLIKHQYLKNLDQNQE